MNLNSEVIPSSRLSTCSCRVSSATSAPSLPFLPKPSAVPSNYAMSSTRQKNRIFSAGKGGAFSAGHLSRGCRTDLAPAAIRRSLLLSPTLLFAGADTRTVINSVLSAYGLPNVAKAQGLTPYYDDSHYVFAYPQSWVIRRNSQRPGWYMSDYQTADKAAIEEVPLPGDPNNLPMLQDLAVRAAVTPGGVLANADRLMLPPAGAVRTEEAVLDGQRYLYLQFPSETLTNSGYAIKRRNFAVTAARGSTVYVMVASARSDQYDDAKAATLKAIIQSFRVRLR